MENKVFINKNLTQNAFHMAMVEIIIPFKDQHNLVVKLMDNIFQTVNTNRYLISLVDCGSKNKSFVNQIEKAKMAGVRTFQFKENISELAALNHVLNKPFRNDINYVCFLKPNVYFDKNNWLKNLGESLINLQKENVSMISPMLRNNINESFDNQLLEDDILPFKCLLTLRALFRVCGLFDENGNSNLEQQLAQKIKSANRKQAYSGNSFYCESI